jgi:hypothetical protein
MVVRQPSTNVPTQAELDAGDADADNWLAYGKAIAARVIRRLRTSRRRTWRS